MDYTNSNTFYGGAALAATGLSVAGFIWWVIGAVAVGTVLLAFARFWPRKQN